MKLDRSINIDGKGKYALVRLRGIEKSSEAWLLLKRLEEIGVLDWGKTGDPDEFFVIKLRDRYADRTLSGYADAVMDDARHSLDEKRMKGLAQYAVEVQKLTGRAGILSGFCKEPD